MFLESDLFRRLCTARALLREPREEPLTVEAVAHAVAISRFHFIRRFEALFGATPHQFRIAERIERAKLLLARGERSVTEICFEVGFESLGSFSALFRREVGRTPSAYRRELRTLFQVHGLRSRDLRPGCLTLMQRLPTGAFRTFREA